MYLSISYYKFRVPYIYLCSINTSHHQLLILKAIDNNQPLFNFYRLLIRIRLNTYTNA